MRDDVLQESRPGHLGPRLHRLGGNRRLGGEDPPAGADVGVLGNDGEEGRFVGHARDLAEGGCHRILNYHPSA
ncbi:MAG TPA: hypothetical protein VJ817_06995 [Gemmatimonadales bacterium]|nr:hypothetical protein [Gemmatimonadales bacterium]